MVDVRSQILAARKPVQSQASSEAPPTGGELAGIAPEGNSPFGIYDKKNTASGPLRPVRQAHKWADDFLRSIARRQERVVLAIRDAARNAENQGLDPMAAEIYVASSIRNAWNLKPDQLSKGLKVLEKQGFLRLTNRKKGRHARFVLVGHAPEHMEQTSLD